MNTQPGTQVIQIPESQGPMSITTLHDIALEPTWCPSPPHLVSNPSIMIFDILYAHVKKKKKGP